MGIVEKIKRFVEKESKKPTSKYGYEPFVFHFTPMAKYAGELADEFGVNKEVVLLAAWLHDIGSIIRGREGHHITGAKIAEKKLRELDYPSGKINLVKKCILNHRGSQKNDRKSIEEQIVAEADAMSTFDNIGGIFKAAFMYEDLNQKDAQISVRRKLENKWKQLKFKKSKDIIRPRYEAAMILLNDYK